MMASEEASPVHLYIYDLSHGIASLLSPAIIGRQIEGVWHTSVVVFGREYFFGGGGITSCEPGTTALGPPLQIEKLGETYVPFQLFIDYVHGLSTSSFTPASYNLLEHNCNHFSDTLAQFVCGGRVPKHILALPDQLPAAARAALQTALQQMGQQHQSLYVNGVRNREDSPDYLTLNDQIASVRAQSAQLERQRSTLAEKVARKERRKEKKRRKLLSEQGLLIDEAEEMAEAAAEAEVSVAAATAGPSTHTADDDAPRRPKEPPIVFDEFDASTEFDALVSALEKFPLSAEEQVSLDEFKQYLVQGEGSWVLGDNFTDFIGRLLGPSSPSEVRRALLRALSAAALRDDVSLVLHADRKTHAILAHAYEAEGLPVAELQALAAFICNLFSNVGPSEWLMYISEWQTPAGRTVSNMRATTKLTVTCLLHEDAVLKDLGSALAYNIATKDVKTVVFEEVCVELGMAALQFLSASPPELLQHRALVTLARLLPHSPDLAPLLAMVGPDPATYRGASQRCDEQIDIIESRIKK